MSDKLLVSLEDITPLRGRERIQEIYFIILGYDIEGRGRDPLQTEGKNFLEILLPENFKNQKWFFDLATPIFKMRKKRKHPFPGGLTLYYGEPGEIASFYFAVIESDRKIREFGEMLAKTRKDLNVEPLIDRIGEVASMANPTIKVIKEGWGLAIKVLETLLIKNGDDIRYTNVFTFRESDNYLRGSHSDWGNQRMNFTIDVE